MTTDNVTTDDRARARGAQARAAVWDDAPKLSETLARAFFDDPMICFVLNDEGTRTRKMPRLFRLLFKLGLPHGACDVTNGYEAVALWRPPGKWHVPLYQYITNGREFLGLFGTGGLRVMSIMDTVESQHPKEPHYYLQAIGTDPAKQGKGYGGVVMRRQLHVADAARMPCYLESSKDTNIPIYQSFGFEVTGEIKLPGGGPTLWPMWRKARAD